jgi:hypothetical protein
LTRVCVPLGCFPKDNKGDRELERVEYDQIGDNE